MYHLKKFFITLPIIVLFFTLFPVDSYAETHVDADNNGYCDVCGRIMNDEVVVDTKDVTYKHQHTAPSGSCYKDGTVTESGYATGSLCQDSSDSWTCGGCGETISTANYSITYYYKGHAVRSASGGNRSCSSGKSCHSGPYDNVPSTSTYGTWTIPGRVLNCTLPEGDIAIGSVSMAKVNTANNDTILKIKPSNINSNTTITGYSWQYGVNGSYSNIGTSESVPMTNIGEYRCVISYKAVITSSYTYTGTVTLSYNAPLSSFVNANTAFYVTKEFNSNGCVLKLNLKDGLDTCFKTKAVTMSSSANAYTWNSLPSISATSVTNSSISGTFLVKNCGRYIFNVQITPKNSDFVVETIPIAYDLTDFDIEVASNIMTRPTFTSEWKFAGLQNEYGQAEQLSLYAKRGGTLLKEIGVRSFTNDTHVVNAQSNLTDTIKTYAGVTTNISEIIKIESTFAISDVVKGTCTTKGSSKLSGDISYKVYLRDSVSGAEYLTYSETIHKENVSETPRNLKNHDCEIKSYEWKDANNDDVSDFLYIHRDCPVSSGDWVITVDLWEDHEDLSSDYISVHHDITHYKTADKCCHVNTSVTYEWLKNTYRTFATSEDHKHIYEHTYTPPTCLDAGFYHYKCTWCEYEYDEETAIAYGHNYRWTIITPMTMEHDGLSRGVCTRCGHIEDRVITSIYKTWQAPDTRPIVAFDPDIYVKPINQKPPIDRPTYYFLLRNLHRLHGDEEIYDGFTTLLGSYNGNGSGFSAGSGRFAGGLGKDGSGFNSGVGEYDNDPLFEELKVDPNEGKTNWLMGLLNNIIGYFRDHPEALVASIIMLIIIIAGIVIYILARRDKKKYKEVNES